MAQNVGINLQKDPEKTLEVGGIIFTNSGGIMFPDSTIQTTAASLIGTANPDVMTNGMVIMTLDNGLNNPITGTLSEIKMKTEVIPAGGFPLLYYYSELITTPGDGQIGSGTTARKEIPTLKMIRNIDFYSNKLINKYYTEDNFCGTLYFIHNTESPDVYSKIRFYNARLIKVTHTVQHAENGTYHHVENLEIIPNCLTFTYYPPGGGGSVNINWNYAANNNSLVIGCECN